MATQTLIQNNKQTQRLSSISIMLEYEIDNTLNSIKENHNFINKMTACLTENLEINNNTNTDGEPKENSPPKTDARKRWKILAKVLRKDSYECRQHEMDDQMASVRRFKSFDLLQQDNLLENNNEFKSIRQPENWYTYKICLVRIEYWVNIHHINRNLTAVDLMGFNNTGNVCVWPSEEALTVYVLSDIKSFNDKWILELGGGMTCLSGLMIAKYAKPYAVHLTDGNSLSVENVRRTICLNELSCYTKCSVLKWENTAIRLGSEIEKFDYILSADCLFFDDVRSNLVDTIWFYLSKNGTALIMAPQRGQTLTIFIDECVKKGFNYQIIYRYNDIIWKRHLELQTSSLYEENIHYPILIKLVK